MFDPATKVRVTSNSAEFNKATKRGQIDISSLDKKFKKSPFIVMIPLILPNNFIHEVKLDDFVSAVFAIFGIAVVAAPDLILMGFEAKKHIQK